MSPMTAVSASRNQFNSFFLQQTCFAIGRHQNLPGARKAKAQQFCLFAPLLSELFWSQMVTVVVLPLQPWVSRSAVNLHQPDERLRDRDWWILRQEQLVIRNIQLLLCMDRTLCFAVEGVQRVRNWGSSPSVVCLVTFLHKILHFVLDLLFFFQIFLVAARCGLQNNLWHRPCTGTWTLTFLLFCYLSLVFGLCRLTSVFCQAPVAVSENWQTICTKKHVPPCLWKQKHVTKRWDQHQSFVWLSIYSKKWTNCGRGQISWRTSRVSAPTMNWSSWIAGLWPNWCWTESGTFCSAPANSSWRRRWDKPRLSARTWTLYLRFVPEELFAIQLP